MSFGGRSSYPAESARPFTVVRAIMAPPPSRIGLITKSRKLRHHINRLLKRSLCYPIILKNFEALLAGFRVVKIENFLHFSAFHFPKHSESARKSRKMFSLKLYYIRLNHPITHVLCNRQHCKGVHLDGKT